MDSLLVEDLAEMMVAWLAELMDLQTVDLSGDLLVDGLV
jgi:hypothetical protein